MAQQRKVALITGGSRGIGKAAALHLARRGVDLVVCSRTVNGTEAFNIAPMADHLDEVALPGSLEETAAEARALGVRALAVKLDLLSRKDCENAVQQTLKEFSRIDILVSSTRYMGPGVQELFKDTDMESIDQAMEANVMAPLYLIKLAIPSMIEQRSGVIINTGGRAREIAMLPGKGGGHGLGTSISKAAMSRAAASLAKELRQYNIAVITLHPGIVVTERRVHEAGRFGSPPIPETHSSPDVPGAAIAFLATHPHPMFFSGRDWEAPDICIAHGLIDPATLPPNVGAPSWGEPLGTQARPHPSNWTY